MKTYKTRAYAKINIGLDVTGKREDGYHLLDSVMQQIGLYDELIFTERNDDRIEITCSDPRVPSDESNLVYKAAAAMREAHEGRIPGLNIEIIKSIPMEAGLAGGSTDGAAAISSINRMFDLGLSPDKLRAIGAQLGADIPFCLTGGTARCEGIGEKITPLRPLPDCDILIVKPEGGMSTGLVYGELDRLNPGRPDMKAVLEGIKEGNLKKICSSMGNVLETVTVRQYPEIEDIKKYINGHGALGSLMSGSGTAVFGIFEKEDRTTGRKVDSCRLHFSKQYQTFITEPGGKL